MMKKLIFRVRKEYFNMLKSGEKTIEYRKDSAFWQKRVWLDLSPEKQAALNLTEDPWQAVFLCGQQVHRREIVRIERTKTPTDFSAQGKKDVPTPTCIAFFLGHSLD
jgi:hypothetical protein